MSSAIIKRTFGHRPLHGTIGTGGDGGSGGSGIGPGGGGDGGGGGCGPGKIPEVGPGAGDGTAAYFFFLHGACMLQYVASATDENTSAYNSARTSQKHMGGMPPTSALMHTRQPAAWSNNSALNSGTPTIAKGRGMLFCFGEGVSLTRNTSHP